MEKFGVLNGYNFNAYLHTTLTEKDKKEALEKAAELAKTLSGRNKQLALGLLKSIELDSIHAAKAQLADLSWYINKK